MPNDRWIVEYRRKYGKDPNYNELEQFKRFFDYKLDSVRKVSPQGFSAWERDNRGPKKRNWG